MKIANVCAEYLSGERNATENPEWSPIEEAVRLLDGSEGQVDIFESNGGLIITLMGKSGAYAMQTSLMVMTDSREEESDEGESIYGNLCATHYLIRDVDTVLSVLKKLIETGRHYDHKPYIWRSNFG